MLAISCSLKYPSRSQLVSTPTGFLLESIAVKKYKALSIELIRLTCVIDFILLHLQCSSGNAIAAKPSDLQFSVRTHSGTNKSRSAKHIECSSDIGDPRKRIRWSSSRVNEDQSEYLNFPMTIQSGQSTRWWVNMKTYEGSWASGTSRYRLDHWRASSHLRWY